MHNRKRLMIAPMGRPVGIRRKQMKLIKSIRHEFQIRPWLKQGYSRAMANTWLREVRYDNRRFTDLTAQERERIHARNYLCKSVAKYDLLNQTDCKYITDFDYILLRPFNNSFTKWFSDLVTQNLVLCDFHDCLPKLYFHLMPREGRKVVLPIDGSDEGYETTYDAFIDLLEEKGDLVVRPSAYSNKRSSYIIHRQSEGVYCLCEEPVDHARMRRFGYRYDRSKVIASGYFYDRNKLWRKLRRLPYDWVIAEPYRPNEAFGEEIGDECPLLKLYIANKALSTTELLDSYLLTPNEEGKLQYVAVNGEDGSFELNGQTHTVPNWEDICRRAKEFCNFTSQVQYVALYIIPTEDGFVIDYVDTKPALPMVAHSDKLNDYLLERLNLKKQTYFTTRQAHRKAVQDSVTDRWIKKHCRPGIRPYMQKLWFRAVQDDLLHTKGANIFQKIWCWRHGFLSYRLWQYGINRKNYKNFLSDYQYHWLNRINNQYQVWLNDKTTTRYVLEPFKQYLSKYYYCIVRQDGQTGIKALQDLPEGFTADFDGILRLLRQEKYLALKPSAGTHGDGFYRLEYTDDGKLLVNGEEQTESALQELICSFKSYYLITEYLFMHDELRKIYPNSVNTVRMAVINQSAKDPQIVQAYMRIGSSRTGFTDNVGYGGICTKIDLETGRYYNGEQITAHHFTPCPIHPDTGVEIEGIIPNWNEVCEGVLNVCRFMPQLEYLGFDIAVTNDGFRIIEVNIHQDLHKVAEHPEVLKQFYQDKMRLKARAYGLKKW